MTKLVEKRTVDMQIIGDWVEPHTRVLDLGCGRGELLDYLVQSKQVSALGVDLDFGKVTACVRRGVPAYQGDMVACMASFPARHFDRVICSRTVQELRSPATVIAEALRVARSRHRRIREPRLLEKPSRSPRARPQSPQRRLHHRVVREPSPPIPFPSLTSKISVPTKASRSPAAPCSWAIGNALPRVPQPPRRLRPLRPHALSVSMPAPLRFLPARLAAWRRRLRRRARAHVRRHRVLPDPDLRPAPLHRLAARSAGSSAASHGKNIFSEVFGNIPNWAEARLRSSSPTSSSISSCASASTKAATPPASPPTASC